MYEKWLHGEQANWWTHAEWFDIMQQPEEFCRYIMNRYHMVATLARHMAISSTGKGCGQKMAVRSPGQTEKAESGGKPPQKASVNTGH
jgi:hypothetical protein